MTTLLRRSGQAPLRIETDEPLRTYDGQHATGREANRWYECELYDLGAGLYAVHVGYRTRWQGERDHDWATAGDAGHIVGWLGEWLVPESIGFPPGEVYQDRQQRLLAELRGQWDDAVARLLNDAAFAEPAVAARDDYAAMDRETFAGWVRDQLRSLQLTRPEACAICDANNGALWLEHSWSGQWANVEDAGRLDGLGEKWEVDCTALAAKIRDAGPAVGFALSWAICQFWRRCDEDTDAVLRALGFIAEGQS